MNANLTTVTWRLAYKEKNGRSREQLTLQGVFEISPVEVTQDS